MQPNDASFMTRALALAERGRGLVNPNPMVGAVVVRSGRVVGEGWHRSFGGPHAETAALRAAGRRARGATLYVTLEPCSHWGKTPPCADAVVRAGLKRVVAAMQDPNPAVSGRGFRRLRQAGVAVTAGTLENEARFLNRGFVKAQEKRLPYVIYKAAQTLDGKTAAWTGKSRWITGPEARAMGHRLRAECDAILVGGNTVRKDNPGLTSHGAGPNPLRLVLSESLDLPLGAKVFDKAAPTWVLTGPKSRERRAERLEKRGVKTLKCFMKNDLISTLMELRKNAVNQILIEGGGMTAETFLKAGLVDEVYLFVAPRLLGGRTAPTSVDGSGWTAPNRGPRLFDLTVSPIGEDLLIHGYLRKAA